MVVQRARVSLPLRALMMPAMPLLNSTGMIGKVVCWRFVRIATQVAQVVALELAVAIVALPVDVEDSVLEPDLAEVAVAHLAVGMVGVEGTEAEHTLVLGLALTLVLLPAPQRFHQIHLPITPHLGGSGAKRSMFAMCAALPV